MAGGEIDAAAIERWALDYLARYASSAQNLRLVLLRRARRRSREAAEAAAPLIAALVARYREARLVDDDAYAIGRALSLNRRGEPRNRIRARLQAKGVAGDAADRALAALAAEAADPDLAAACAFARRRHLGPYRTRPVERARELGSFARAGFARRVAEAVLACADLEAIEALLRDGLG
jgi:regulatory protein